MENSYFLAVCLNPVLQKTLLLPSFAEGRVNRLTEHYLDASGKGVNVCRGLASLGARAVHLTQAGGWNREIFLKLCAEKGIEVRPVESGSEVRFCYTLLDSGRNATTEIVERARPVASGTEDRVRAGFTGLLERAHTLIISGTRADGFSEGLFPDMVKAAKAAGKTVILDIAGQDLLHCLEHRPDIVKPNREEFAATFPGTGADGQMLRLWNEYGAAVILTDGGNECLYTEGGEVKSLVPPALPAGAVLLNTTGCGDAFTAGFAHRYRSGGNMTVAVLSAMGEAAKKAMRTRP
jgi:fructose-1-phosphate kinase PfkB-like protein